MNELISYTIICVMGLLGSLVSIIIKDKIKNKENKKQIIIKNILGSLFVSYLTYEVACFYELAFRYSTAIACFCGYLGNGLLDKLEVIFDELINKKLK